MKVNPNPETKINMSFSKKLYGVKVELEKRADEMNMSSSKYCIMVLTRHIASGERFHVAGDR